MLSARLKLAGICAAFLTIAVLSAFVYGQEAPPPPPQQESPSAAQQVQPPPPGAQQNPPGGQPVPANAQPVPPEDVDVLTRGPVHEAYAEPVPYTPQPGYQAPQAPPPNINEIPPDEQPQGPQVEWVPGYWNWDSDSRRYIWVSGTWRVPPPGCSWVPGYWNQGPDGYRWVPGFWTSSDPTQIEYLPQPPANLEEGPSGPAPSEDVVWVPGNWVWSNGRYLWRHGIWTPAQANWVYVPAHYNWTPYGYVYIPGHWDYTLEHRGVVFAPVAFDPAAYQQPIYEFTPTIVIQPDALLVSLFCQPQYCSYFFGDYYSPRYARQGFYPWYEARDRRAWYDPIFYHEEWRHHSDPHWYDNLHAEYDRRVKDRDLRPAHTWREEQQRVAHLPAAEKKMPVLATPLRTYAQRSNAPMKFVQVSPQKRQEAAQRANELHQYAQQRSHWEGAHVAQAQPERKAPEARPETPRGEEVRPQPQPHEEARPQPREEARPEAKPEAPRHEEAKPEAPRIVKKRLRPGRRHLGRSRDLALQFAARLR